MSLGFLQSDIARPLTQLHKEWEDDVKGFYIFLIQVEVIAHPLAQDVEKDETIYKYQQRRGGVCCL